MDKTLLIAVSFTVVVLVLIFLFKRKAENFNIPLRSSSAFDWNLGPGYGEGYGTGYGLYGMWPGNLPRQPWTWWQWQRRPLVFVTPFTPVPQIDYNTAPYLSHMKSNYNISLLPSNGKIRVAIDGMAGRTLQLDRLRNYYFHIYSPGAPIIFTADGTTPYSFPPNAEGTVQVNFDESSPDILYYMIKGQPGSGGIIYINKIQA